MEGELSIEHALTEITELKDLNDECDNGFQIRNNILSDKSHQKDDISPRQLSVK